MGIGLPIVEGAEGCCLFEGQEAMIVRVLGDCGVECEFEADGFGGYGVGMVCKRVFLVVIEEEEP